MKSCPACGAPLETPVACGACGAVQDVADSTSPFEIFGLAPAARLDERDLRRRSTRFARLVHPDFFSTAAPEARALAEQNSARLNDAFQVLSDPARRADRLVNDLGGPTEAAERSMTPAFLSEVLEWNEILEEARAAAGVDARLDPLGEDLLARREQGLARVQDLLDPLPQRASRELVAARRELNALRYLDRALREIESLRLARAERR